MLYFLSMNDDRDHTDAEELRAAIGDFVRRVRTYDAMPPGQAAVLGYLDRFGALSIADLARHERVRHQSMTRTVNLLKDQRLVAVGPGETDRRLVVVTITGDGVRRLDDERRRRASGIARAIREDLSDDERRIIRQVPAILRKLSSSTEDQT
jgi:DNA-binding MarR family transcriptional regulator